MTEEEENPFIPDADDIESRHQQNLLLILMIVKKLKLIDICIFVENESYVFATLKENVKL